MREIRDAVVTSIAAVLLCALALLLAGCRAEWICQSDVEQHETETTFTKIRSERCHK